MVDHDVVVVGDGPAGVALGAALMRCGVDAVVVGPGQPWTPTYGTWVTPRLGSLVDTLAWQGPVVAWGTRRHELAVPYGVFDNERLRAALSTDAVLHHGTVRSVVHIVDEAAVDVDGLSMRARLVIDATGSGAFSTPPGGGPPPMQTAYGLVLDELPDGFEPTLMDWRPIVGAGGGATFAYTVGLGSGRWLVEETSLARSPAMPISDLRARLAQRIGVDLTASARRVEEVSIPMRPGAPRAGSAVVPFGAAARYVHPATGYSVAESLAAAPRVAAAIAQACAAGMSGRPLEQAAWSAVWPTAMRRTRRLHDHGLRVLQSMGDRAGSFFDEFFDLPTTDWMRYLRIDASPGSVSATMWSVFRQSPWPVRRRLAVASAAGRDDAAR